MVLPNIDIRLAPWYNIDTERDKTTEKERGNYHEDVQHQQPVR